MVIHLHISINYPICIGVIILKYGTNVLRYSPSFIKEEGKEIKDKEPLW